MFKKASHVTAGEISQITTRNYNNQSTNAVTVAKGGQYSTHVEIKAGAYHHHEVRAVDPLKELVGNVAVGAMHNSEHRADAPKCHPRTRKSVQEDIFGWISHGIHDEKERGMLWLTGPAGAGKTAIMGTICDRLQERGQLAAAFYFSSHKGATTERKSRRRFVTTLAYQLQQHPLLKERLSKPMLNAIREDPTLFEASLKGQLDALVLQPLRRFAAYQDPSLDMPLVIAIDGVDECGEPRYLDPDQSREKDQIDVLSVLLHATRDPSFPCRIIVASRPEDCIRHFFSGASASPYLDVMANPRTRSASIWLHLANPVSVRIDEIFLDDKYGPDEDIRVFLRHEFAELSRRYRFAPSTWPRKGDIETLVDNASGQFVYAATIMRFIDSPPAPPKRQLEIVLSFKPTVGGSSPFRRLDDLYIGILNLSRSPVETVLWLKAHERIQENASTAAAQIVSHTPTPSAWTVDRLFESSEGQARILFGVPSLLYQLENRPGPRSLSTILCDSAVCGESCRVPASLISSVGWNSTYSFYHKSFLDFLHSQERCGNAFPGTGPMAVAQWLWDRLSIVILCGGPEAPVDARLLSTFRMCFLSIFGAEIARCKGSNTPSRDALIHSDPTQWLWSNFSFFAISRRLRERIAFEEYMFVVVHKDCRRSRPCGPGCKRWRGAISETRTWQREVPWSPFKLFMDRFCIKRIPSQPLGRPPCIVVCVKEPTYRTKPIENIGGVDEVGTAVWLDTGTTLDACGVAAGTVAGKIAYSNLASPLNGVREVGLYGMIVGDGGRIS
ncbi:hypothetical protein NMY22_g7485 [Coprinellus aureogranulatus]|nr:hypothetical protein NMY22_g7485 [Coprinellus aureogranulatus]